METNSFLLWQGDEAVVIDPSIGADQLLEKMRELQRQGVRLCAIWNTHGHIDHVYDNARWKGEWDAPIFCHRDDHFFLEHLREQSLWFGLDEPQVVQPDAELRAGQTLKVGDLNVEVLELPGHSPGSVAFLFDDHLVSGDVIFRNSYGRIDLPGCRCQSVGALARSRVENAGANAHICAGTASFLSIAEPKQIPMPPRAN